MPWGWTLPYCLRLFDLTGAHGVTTQLDPGQLLQTTLVAVAAFCRPGSELASHSVASSAHKGLLRSGFTLKR